MTQAARIDQTALIESSRSQRLRQATHAAHERLDQSLMERDSFRSLAGYVPFLTMQFAFHRDIAALYADPRLQAALPGLAERSRLALLEQDMADLGVAACTARPPLFTAATLPDPAVSLGWLYVAEGSNLGAALLRKLVAAIGLSDSYGARHLAPAAEGPAAHWRQFVAVLDAAPLSQDEENAAIAGARDAFVHVASLADGQLG